jgi:hypothetical protein
VRPLPSPGAKPPPADFPSHSTCAISVVRIRFLKLTEDFTWDNVESAGWSIGELCSGITCACLPTFRPLLSRYFPGLSTRLTRDSNSYYRSGGSSDNRTGQSRGFKQSKKSSRNDTVFGTVAVYESKDELRLPIAHGMSNGPSGPGRGGSARGYAADEWGSEESDIGIPIMRPDGVTLETRCAASKEGRAQSVTMGSNASSIRVECDIVQTLSQPKS